LKRKKYLNVYPLLPNNIVILESRKGMQGRSQIFEKGCAVAYINEYYPFGLQNQQTSSTQFGSKEQRYKYNGKELFKDFKLEMEDYGARLYSPQIGRWTLIDQKAEKYVSMSPYNYAANNPIKFVDPNGKDIRLGFQSESAKNAYVNTVNNSLGGFYSASTVNINDGLGYNNQVVLSPTSMQGPMTESQSAFLEEYSKALLPGATVRQDVVESDPKVEVGSFYSGKLDMSDVAAFDKAGKGGSSSAGALIHETSEQLSKSQQGLAPNEWSKVVKGAVMSPELLKAHEAGTKSENKVNGNTRFERKEYYLEKNGTKTGQYTIPNPDGSIEVKKNKIQ
jgi:RHS repeat-associated protein